MMPDPLILSLEESLDSRLVGGKAAGLTKLIAPALRCREDFASPRPCIGIAWKRVGLMRRRRGKRYGIFPKHSEFRSRHAFELCYYAALAGGIPADLNRPLTMWLRPLDSLGGAFFCHQ